MAWILAAPQRLCARFLASCKTLRLQCFARSRGAQAAGAIYLDFSVVVAAAVVAS